MYVDLSCFLMKEDLLDPCQDERKFDPDSRVPLIPISDDDVVGEMALTSKTDAPCLEVQRCSKNLSLGRNSVCLC